MKLTAQQIMDAYLTLRRIAQDNRALPQKGSYRVARLLSKMQADAQPILEQYDARITAYAYKQKFKDADGNVVAEADQFSVPPDEFAAFQAKWKEDVGGQEHELAIEPIPLDQLDNHAIPGAVSASELLALGDLVAE